MTTIQARPRAQWLPSRSHHAIFRLIGYVVSRKAADQAPVPGILVIDRNQNGFENYAVALLTVITTAAYLAEALTVWLNAGAAIAVAVVLAPVAIQVPLYIVGLFVMPAWRRISRRKPDNNRSAVSIASMAGFLGASIYFAMGDRLVRPLALLWLLLAVLNALAAAVMWLLRGRVRELESRCGV